MLPERKILTIDANAIFQRDIEAGVIPAKASVVELVCDFSLLMKNEIASSLHSSQRQCYQANNAVVASIPPYRGAWQSRSFRVLQHSRKQEAILAILILAHFFVSESPGEDHHVEVKILFKAATPPVILLEETDNGLTLLHYQSAYEAKAQKSVH